MGRGRPKKTVSPLPDLTNASSSIPTLQPSNLQSSVSASSSRKVDDDAVNETMEEAKSKESPETLVPNRKLWVDILKDNRNPAKGRSMKYIAPKSIEGGCEVAIEEADIVDEIQFGRPSLVLYALGCELSMHAVKNFMSKNWYFVQLPDMYYHEEGYFILRFNSFKDRDDVLMKGPYSIRNMPLLIREWRPEFNLQTDLLRTLPIWVKLPNLPLYLWGETSLNKIGSALGVPIVTDECTANRLRISYARIMVEMDITKDLPSEIIIRDNHGEKMRQAIEYEWRPVFCGSCQKFGHNCDKPKPKARIWQPKAPVEIKNSALPTEEEPPVTKTQPTISPLPVIQSPTDATITDPVQRTPDAKQWTSVRKSGKERGKRVMIEETDAFVLSTNDFDALGILSDLLVL
ncbi:uncharacterized protein LOC131658056 [Vicia villosa]|uniref:uncharacterized protein LOC131658056 n=1 Tax=Vicia villosa TaxID=3911 RepID=UPI00273B4E89|nr:uncharacterized protein LOC131658056 [Vicia villosa]